MCLKNLLAQKKNYNYIDYLNSYTFLTFISKVLCLKYSERVKYTTYLFHIHTLNTKDVRLDPQMYHIGNLEPHIVTTAQSAPFPFCLYNRRDLRQSHAFYLKILQFVIAYGLREYTLKDRSTGSPDRILNKDDNIHK